MRLFELSASELADHVDDAYWADQGAVERVSDPDLLTRLRVHLRGHAEVAAEVRRVWLEEHAWELPGDELGLAEHWFDVTLLGGSGEG